MLVDDLIYDVLKGRTAENLQNYVSALSFTLSLERGSDNPDVISFFERCESDHECSISFSIL